MKNYKNRIFLMLFIILTLSVILINKFIDPFDCKQNIQSHDITNIIKKIDYIYTSINLTKKEKYDTIYTASSSGSECINFGQLIRRRERVAIITHNDINPIEQYNLLKYFLKLHPEVKNVIVSMEIPRYLTCHYEFRIPRKPSNSLTDFLNLYLSLDATKKSIEKIISYKKEKKEKVNQEEIDLEDKNNNVSLFTINTKRRYIYKKVCEYDNIETLKKIHKLMDEKQLNAIYFIPPVNALYLADVQHQGYYKDVEIFKQKAAEIVPYYDMGYINKYTTKPIGFYFRDAVHSNNVAVSKLILNTLLNNSIYDKDFAVYVSKENVNQVLKEQRNSLFEYISKNNKKINFYVKESMEDFLYNKEEEPLYFNDLTDEEKKLMEINS